MRLNPLIAKHRGPGVGLGRTGKPRYANAGLSPVSLGPAVGRITGDKLKGNCVGIGRNRVIDDHAVPQMVPQANATTVGVGLPSVEPALDDLLTAFATENARLIRNLTGTLLEDVEGSIARGFRRGRLTRDISAEIQQRVGVARRRANLIARDQIASLNGELTQVRQATMGVTRYTWRSSRDELVRDTHEEFDGQVFTWATGSPEGHPGEPINCRCVAEPVLDELIGGT